MKHRLNNLVGYDIETRDGVKGTVEDFLFDEEGWIVRYLIADLGVIFPGKKVVIPKSFLNEPNHAKRHFSINLSKEDLEKSPPLESQPSISREYEETLNRYYRIDDYWAFPYVPPMSTRIVVFPPRPVRVPSKKISEKNTKSNVRSIKEVQGYDIEVVDGKIGHLDDLLVDDTDWQIVYALTDTKNWVPWSKKVLVSTEWMVEISYVYEYLKIDLDKETIQSAPEFDYSKPITEKYERQLLNYYEGAVMNH